MNNEAYDELEAELAALRPTCLASAGTAAADRRPRDAFHEA